MRILLGMMLWTLAITGNVWAQCGCGEECNSGCQCGCSDPDKYPPAAPDSGGHGNSSNVTLLSQLTLGEMGATGSSVLGNDCWGWTDRVTGREFAIFGLTNATAFVEITDPVNPVYIGSLPAAGTNATWRDMKVFQDRCYVVADGSGSNSHGVQVFNLKRLLRIGRSLPVTFSANARYTGLGRAHNIAINEGTGFAYVVGSSGHGSAGGLIMLDLKQGVLPVLAGVFSGDGYTHDVQVVEYAGPDPAYRKKEIAFCANEDTLTIVNVSNKTAPQLVSRSTYPVSRYSHQGWLSEDHRYFFMDDELDELQLGPFPTRTRIWDVSDLDNPVYVGHHSGTESTIDHNLYVKGNFIYQANYTSGLRILKIDNAATAQLHEVGYFDTYGADNDLTFNGAWSCYPFFKSGSIIVSDRQNGLYVVRFTPPAGG